MNRVFRSLNIGLSGLVLAGCSSFPQFKSGVDITGDWKVEAIEGVVVNENSKATVKFESANSVAGNASCNLYFGTYEINEGRLSFSDLGTTMMMCSEEVMDQEGRFLQAMGQVTQFELIDKGLMLKGEQGRVLIRASHYSEK